MSAQPFGTAGEAPLTGHRAIDSQGEAVGTVSDVLFDDTGTARWVVIDPGVLRAEHYVPVSGTRQTDDGELVLPVEREVVQQAPKADKHHIMTPELERELEAYYHHN